MNEIRNEEPAQTSEVPPVDEPQRWAQTGAQTEAPSEAPSATATAESRPAPRTGPIVWGAIFLAFCIFIAAQKLSPGSIDAPAFAITSVIGLGVLLLVVGVAVLVRNARQSKHQN